MVSQEDYESWARSKWNEIQQFLNPCTEDGELDPVRLNQVLTKFGGYFAWAITIQEIESNKLNILQAEYDEWYKACWSKAERSMRDEGGGTIKLTLKSIEAKVSQMADGQVEVRNKALVDGRNRMELLKGFVRVLDKQAGILQTLSSNMRSELFFAGGIPIGRDITGDEKTKKLKSVVRKAMKGQDPDNY